MKDKLRELPAILAKNADLIFSVNKIKLVMQPQCSVKPAVQTLNVRILKINGGNI